MVAISTDTHIPYGHNGNRHYTKNLHNSTTKTSEKGKTVQFIAIEYSFMFEGREHN